MWKVVVAALVIAGCTASPNPIQGAHPDVFCCTEVLGDSAGFLLGVWHGFIAPGTTIASIFTDVGVYEARNNGPWYNGGFLFGAFCGMMTILGIGGAAASNN